MRRTLEVRIPKGIRHGQVIRVQGEGEPPRPEDQPDGSGPRGDLHVVVATEEHDRFQRDENDLVTVVPMAFAQAALGANIEIGLLEGGTTELKIEPGTQHGEVIRLPNLGCPDLRSPEHRGDLVAILQLVVPKKLDDTQRELLTQFADTEEIDVDHASPGFWSRIKNHFS